MPIYEFYCGDCHRIFDFLSRAVDTQKRPACPRCGRAELSRQVSAFAISKGRKEEPAPPPPGPGLPGMPEMDEARMERVMEGLARDAEGLDEDDPRQAARLMRRLFEGTGMPVGREMEEALRRMESGEDPDKIEEEMGDVLGQDPFGAGGAGEEGAAEPREPKKSLAGLRRRLRPPSHDPQLYEM